VAVHQVLAISYAGYLALIEPTVSPIQKGLVGGVDAEFRAVGDGRPSPSRAGTHEEERCLGQVANPRVRYPARNVRPARPDGDVVASETISVLLQARGEDRAAHYLDGQRA
jgi:hypothetical protein